MVQYTLVALVVIIAPLAVVSLDTSCEPGQYFTNYEDTADGCSDCLDDDDGLWSDGSSGECNVCYMGYGGMTVSQTACTKCDIGYYADYERLATREEYGTHGDCAKCPGDMTTLSTGASSEYDCGCPAGTRDDYCEPCTISMYREGFSSGAGNCQDCPYSSTRQSEWVWMCRRDRWITLLRLLCGVLFLRIHAH